MNLNELFNFQRGCVISRIEHFFVKCNNCDASKSATPTAFKLFPSNYEKIACKQIDDKYLTQPNDIVIYLKSPFTVALIDENSAGLIVSSNYLILRATSTKIKLHNFIAFLKKQVLSKDSLAENRLMNRDMTIKLEEFKNHQISIQQYLFLIGDIKFNRTTWNLLWSIIGMVAALMLVIVANTIYSSTSSNGETGNFLIFLSIELVLTIASGILIIVFLSFLGKQNLWGKRFTLRLRAFAQKHSSSNRIVNRMQVLDELLQKQLISQQEYATQKEKILKRLR